jgi:hypothetical protein
MVDRYNATTDDNDHPVNLIIGEDGFLEEWDGKVHCKVWDSNSLAWVAMTQPGGVGGGYETVFLKNIAGSQINPAEKNPLDGYELSDWTDEMTNPQYHGFLHASGAWAIKKMDASTNPRTVRWAVGASSYGTNFSGRGGLSYDYFDAIF